MRRDHDTDRAERWKRGLPIARGLAFLVGVFVVFAGVFLYLAIQAGRAELRQLCEQGVHPRVYRKVSAEGYFDAGVSCLPIGCWTILTARDYRFIEFEKNNSKPWHAITEDGLYRLSKVRRDSGQCHERIYADMRKSLAYSGFVASGYCLALQELERHGARYGLFSEQLPSVRLHHAFLDSTISIRRFVIRDLLTGDVVVQRNTYLLSQNWPTSLSSFRNVLGCRDVGVVSSLPDIINVESYIRPE